MISLTPLRTLDLASPPSPGRPAHVSAASGLATVGEFLYVVADDELNLGVFPKSGAAPGHLIRLFDGALPDERAARKASKPDLETLLLLPPASRHPHGALLALGSGSTARRFRGAVLPLAEDGQPGGPPLPIDLAGLYAPLAGTFPALNIEGGIVSGGMLVLLHRGNKTHPANAIIRGDLAQVLAPTRAAQPSPIISWLDLGALDGIPLAVTDAAVLPDGTPGLPADCLVFTAVAEDTADPYRDGPVAGAAIGMATLDGVVHRLDRVEQRVKLEGVAVDLRGGVATLLLVDDPDDPDVAAKLYSAALVP